nr:hypothetical protein CFP56_21781 [Quercus suber]
MLKRFIMSAATSKPKLNPRTFPRPPAIERTSRHLEVKWNGQLIADTTEGYWVLETHHPPTYYLPQSAIKVQLLPSSHSSFCEWKGRATYHDISTPGRSNEIVHNRIWSYAAPTERFKPIQGYLCFYAGPWDCYVDGERVEPQPGDFYGGWMTSEIERSTVKGGPGTWGW